MNLVIDPASGIPIYVQLKNQIRFQIAARRIAPGAQLPTVRQLAVDLTINPNTVARVYLELEREGVLVTQQGRGTYVAELYPHSESLDAERREKLRGAIEKVAAEGQAMGFSLEEIEREVVVIVKRLKGDSNG
jgi:GntR family transcriptional regulator